MAFFDDARAIPVPFNLLDLPIILLIYLPYQLLSGAASVLRGDRANFARRRFEEHRELTQEEADRRMRYSRLMLSLIQRSRKHQRAAETGACHCTGGAPVCFVGRIFAWPVV